MRLFPALAMATVRRIVSTSKAPGAIGAYRYLFETLNFKKLQRILKIILAGIPNNFDVEVVLL